MATAIMSFNPTTSLGNFSSKLLGEALLALPEGTLVKGFSMYCNVLNIHLNHESFKEDGVITAKYRRYAYSNNGEFQSIDVFEGLDYGEALDN